MNQFPPPNGTPNDPIEHGLSHLAASAPSTPDWDDLTGRVRQNHRRRVQALGGALGLVALAGPALGFVVGQRDSSANDRVATRSPAAASTAAGGQRQSSPVTTAASTFDGKSASSEAYQPKPFTKLFVETVNGYQVRVYKDNNVQFKATEFGTEGWAPPADCFPTANIVVEYSDATVAGMLNAMLGGSPMFGGGGFQLQPIGIQEGAPALAIVGAVDPSVTTATVTFADGSKLTPFIRDGVLIALRPDPTLTFESIGSTGFQSITIDTGKGPKPLVTQFTRRKECEPPPPPAPELPAAGKNQPKDAVAARAEIAKVVSQLIDGNRTAAEHQAVVDDASGLDGLPSNFPPEILEIAKSARATLAELVFIDKDRAVGLVTIETSISTNSHQFVEVRQVDGTWKATRGTFCELIMQTGTECPNFNYEDSPSARWAPRGEPGTPEGGFATTGRTATTVK